MVHWGLGAFPSAVGVVVSVAGVSVVAAAARVMLGFSLGSWPRQTRGARRIRCRT